MEFTRATSALTTPRGGVNDENASVMPRSASVKGQSGGLGGHTAVGPQKTFAHGAAPKTPGRAALGNITNGTSAGGGGGGLSVRKPSGLSNRSDAGGRSKVVEKPEMTESEKWFAEARAQMSEAELKEMRARAERYVDEDDDIEYFGKTREQQKVELEAHNRAETEARVRELLNYSGGFKPRAPDSDHVRVGMRHLEVAKSLEKTSDVFDLGGEDDLCNFLSPTKAWDDLGDDSDVLAPPSVDDVLAAVDDEMDDIMKNWQNS